MVFILSFTAWLQPIHAVSALEQKGHDESIFINYEQFHKPAAILRTLTPSREANSGSRIQGNTSSQSSAYHGRDYTKEEVQQLIKDYSREYRIDSVTPLCIAYKESGYNQFSKNKSSSASGVFQYLASTWAGTDEGKAGLSMFDADANVRAAVKYMAVHKSTRPWVVAPSCPPLRFL